ncbi:Putative FAD dependent oxidoreductase, FAD/NAD(P)-binding domain superfamily [Septoria linicola]|uniref:FAD dependent oxidoreductase, FAD/NAD(P)-binding domain superfamily n=1 Tax=Septoria linicola TaxID=215465 RepID=A0A9Q9EPI8_9PEZI|nr:putative FAD dependent oxidoreductase, FAD/NAD(P)-binding domain superfamily [Septoria linicola]USW58816.1 Putative FAD dependent oxidoreductase, FAD/NAD(P)-binding domain superfamily [Septoria linicola]
MPKIPSSVIAQLIHSAHQDPQLPRVNPTEACWQLPASPIAHIRSENLPTKTTYAIIGSGVTGCSVAKNLLEGLNLHADADTDEETAKGEVRRMVTVLEARTLTSGATGRNGGHLVSPLPEEFCEFEKYLGREATTKIARFANRTLEAMFKLAEEGDEELRNAAEARRVLSVCAYYDRGVFEEVKRSMRRYEECLPEEKGDSEIFEGEEAAREKWNMKDAVGVITNRAGAFWPYRLVTGLFSRLLENYPGRFALETETPVTSVEHDPSSDVKYPYLVNTNRGTIRATKVIYCCNGYTSHLLAKLRGKIWPLRGTMSVQASGPNFPNEGSQKSWSTLGKPRYDAQTGHFSYGLYYITQNSHTGDIFIGGEKQILTELLTSDDTTISLISKDALESVLPTIFDKGWPEGQKPEIKKVWSGIMGFTPDHMPWVGALPSSITGVRPVGGEYIAAGFNGYGMPLCWGSGEAVAKMILGKEKEVEEWLPENFVISEERLRSVYSTTEAGIYNMLMAEPGLWTKVRMGVGSVVKNIAEKVFG